LLAASRIPDPTPLVPPGTYVMLSKRDRLFNALTARQRHDGCGNASWRSSPRPLPPSRKRGHPLLALNNMSTDTERSRQKGLANSLSGVFGSLRNPTAHEPKIKSTMTEQDAVDELCHMSYLHRRLDEWPGGPGDGDRDLARTGGG
jgi:Protein of unknown function (Hypoth_ymh)